MNVQEFVVNGMVILDFKKEVHVLVRLSQLVQYYLTGYIEHFPPGTDILPIAQFLEYKQYCQIAGRALLSAHTSFNDINVFHVKQSVENTFSIVESHTTDQTVYNEEYRKKYTSCLESRNRSMLNSIFCREHVVDTFEMYRSFRFVTPNPRDLTETITVKTCLFVADILYTKALYSMDAYMRHEKNAPYNLADITELLILLKKICCEKEVPDVLFRISIKITDLISNFASSNADHSFLYSLCVCLFSCIRNDQVLVTTCLT